MSVVGMETATTTGAHNETGVADLALNIRKQALAFGAASVDIDHGELVVLAGHARKALSVPPFHGELPTGVHAHAGIVANRWSFSIVRSERKGREIRARRIQVARLRMFRPR